MSEASEDGYELSLGTMAMNLTFAVVEKKLRERLIAPQDLTWEELLDLAVFQEQLSPWARWKLQRFHSNLLRYTQLECRYGAKGTFQEFFPNRRHSINGPLYEAVQLFEFIKLLHLS